MKTRSLYSILYCFIFLFPPTPISAQVLEEVETYEIADDDYSPWKQYSKAGFWIVPLATPFKRSPYDDLRYQEVDGSGRTGAELAEWAYVHEQGANVGIKTPDGLEVFEGEKGNFGLRKHKSDSELIPPVYQQLEYLKKDILVGWIGDSLDIWTSEGKRLRRIHYGFRGGKPPRFVVNLPLIQRGGNEIPYFGREKGVMGVYTRDSDFLAPRTIKWYETFYPNTHFHGLYRIANQASIIHKGFATSRDSSLTDSLYVMLVEYKGEFQLLANQGRDLFRQLPFSFPFKGKKEGVFKGHHLGRVGPLYPSIYYEYAKPKLEIKGNQLKLNIRFTEKKPNSKEERIFSYQLSGKKSDYNEMLTLISNQYANQGFTPIYQLKKGETASVITAYGYEIIPAGTYKKFLAGRGNSIVAQSLDDQFVCLNRAGKPMSKSTLTQLNRLKFEEGIQYLKGGSLRGGILFRDSLDFYGPFLPDHRLFILNQDTVFFVDPNQEMSLIYEPGKNQITGTIPWRHQQTYQFHSRTFPF